MPKRIAQTTLNATTIDILNVIRENASYDYQQNVPEVQTANDIPRVGEVIYGTPSRFTDPARFSFAHGGKDGHPFPVPLKIYDESIRVLRESIEKSKLGYKDKSECIRRLHTTALNIEKKCSPEVDFDAAIEFERSHSKEWKGKTV